MKYVCLCAHIHVTTRTAGMHIPVYTYRAASVSMPTTACVCMCTHPREHAGLARNMYTHVNTCVHIQVSMCIHPRAHVRSWDHLRFHLPSLAYFSNGQIIPQAIPRLYNVVLIACTPEILLLRSTLGHFPGVSALCGSTRTSYHLPLGRRPSKKWGPKKKGTLSLMYIVV